MASRAVPVPGPKADPGTQAATADPGTPQKKIHIKTNNYFIL